MRNLVDIFADIVTEIQTEYNDNGKPFYEYGHPAAIVNELQMKLQSSTDRTKRYPGIFLFTGFREDGQPDKSRLINSFTVILAASTKPEYTTEKRYTNSFDPVLIPLFNLLIKHLQTNTEIDWDESDYSMYIRDFWGKTGLYGSTSNIFNDYLDAIEIEIRDLKILNSC